MAVNSNDSSARSTSNSSNSYPLYLLGDLCVFARNTELEESWR